MITAPLDQARIGLRLRRLLADRRRYDALDDTGRATWRADRLAELRRHAMARSPFYAGLHRGLDDASLADLPVVTKAALFEHFDAAVTDRRLTTALLRAHVGQDGRAGRAGRVLGRYRVGASTGSSGQPGLFAYDEGEWVGLLANAARSRVIAGRSPVQGQVRSAKVASPSPWHLSRQVAATLQDPRKPALALSATRPMTEIAQELDRWDPHVLSAYPSVLRALAAAQRDGRLSIQPLQVFSSGEPLTSAARQEIEQAWGGAPFDQYVTTEAGFVGVECTSHCGLHILDDHVVVEVVDAEGRPTPPGTPGHRVLVTVLGSRTLPLIRYALEDSVVPEDGPCSCGVRSPRLRAVVGRARELLVFPAAGREGDIEIHPVVFTSVLDVAPASGWKVVHRPGLLRVSVAAADPFDAAPLIAALEGALRAAGAVVPRIDVDVQPCLPPTPGGKAARIVSEDGSSPRAG